MFNAAFENATLLRSFFICSCSRYDFYRAVAERESNNRKSFALLCCQFCSFISCSTSVNSFTICFCVAIAVTEYRERDGSNKLRFSFATAHPSQIYIKSLLPRNHVYALRQHLKVKDKFTNHRKLQFVIIEIQWGIWTSKLAINSKLIHKIQHIREYKFVFLN